MTDMNESYRDDGQDVEASGLEHYSPDDASTSALDTGRADFASPDLGVKSDDLTNPPAGARTDLEISSADAVVRGTAERIAERGLTARFVDVSPVTDAVGPVQDRNMQASDVSRVTDCAPVRRPEAEDHWLLGHEVVREERILLETKELMQRADDADTDDYIKDAAGHVDRIVEVNTSRQSSLGPSHRAANMRRATFDLTTYAARTNNEAAARFGFSNLPRAHQWIAYADAYSAPNGNEQLVSDWRTELDTAHEAEAAHESSATQAARMFALTMSEIHAYTSIIDPGRLAALKEQQRTAKPDGGDDAGLAALAAARAEHRQAAIDNGTRLNALLDGMRTDTNRWDEDSFIRLSAAHECQERATEAFARAGMWEGVAALHTNLNDSAVQGMVRTVKAAQGQLGFKERQLLRRDGETGKFLRWLDDVQQGNEGKPPAVSSDRIQNIRLLERLVPARLQELGLEPSTARSGLHMALDTNDYESVRAQYAGVLSGHSYNDSLRAALLVSQHLLEVQATESAHEVLENGFLTDIGPIEARVDEMFDDGWDGPIDRALELELAKLYEESNELKDPVTSLHAKARVATMYFKVSPDSQKLEAIMKDIHTQWDVLERRDGGEQELVGLYKSLKSAGMDLVPQWKRNGTDGYIGYRAQSLLAHRRAPSDSDGLELKTGKQMYIATALEVVDTAAALNALLGTERYRVEIDPSDMMEVDTLRTLDTQEAVPIGFSKFQYTKHSVELTGPWRLIYSTERFGCYKEFENAAGNLRSGWALHDDTTKSDRLRELVEQAEAEWQEELAASSSS